MRNKIKYKKENIKMQKYILPFEIVSFKHRLTRSKVNSSGEFSGNEDIPAHKDTWGRYNAAKFCLINLHDVTDM